MSDLETRAERARRGSRRQRDREALAIVEGRDTTDRDERIRAATRPTRRAAGAWTDARAALERSMPAGTFALWLADLDVAGEKGDGLVVTVPDTVRAWIERRFARTIGDAVRETTDYAGVYLIDEVTPDTDDDLL